MSIDERIAALRRVTTRRGATRAEADTARRLADQLERKHGLKPARSRTRRQKAASRPVLPELADARIRRRVGLWLGAAIDRVELWGAALLVAYFSLTPILLLAIFDPWTTKATHDRVLEWLLYGKLALGLLLALLGLLVLAPLTFARWWLRTPPRSRLREATARVIEWVPVLAVPMVVVPTTQWLEKTLNISWAGLPIAIVGMLLALAYWALYHKLFPRENPG